MKKIILILSIFATINISAQNEILNQIETNNHRLKALRLKTEALSKENEANSRLEDPSIKFGFLWGNGGIRRNDFEITQSIDFATISGLKKANVLSENELLKFEYDLALSDISLEASNLISEIIYRNALIEIYKTRVELATQLESVFKKGLNLGEYSIIDYHNAQMTLTNVKTTYNQYIIERDALINDLAILNGGKIIEITDTELVTKLLPKSFELWIENQNSTTVQYYRKALQNSESQLKLRKSEAVPSLEIGYVSEIEPDNSFRGIVLGLQIPLWSAGSKIKAAKMKLEAAKEEENAAIFAFEQKAKGLYNKALQLSLSISDCSIDDSFINELEKAIEIGHINIVDYIETVDYYFETLELGLQTQLNYCLTINELENL